MGLRDLHGDWRCLLSALYLPGSPHGAHVEKRRWPAVLSTLRTLQLSIESAAESLRSAGHFGEAAAVGAPGILDWAVARLNLSATCLDGDYPTRWLEVLGDRAPPAIWRIGATSTAPCLGVVGSRDVEPEVHRFCASVGREAVRLGFRVVSGGAAGCDSAALGAATEAGGETLLLAPYGIEWWGSAGSGGLGYSRGLGQVVLSAAEPSAPFSRPLAMERNALIYAAGQVCVVGQVRFREGGTWHGASSALRRRLCHIFVRKPRKDDTDEAMRGARALVALGARYLEQPSDLEGAIAALPADSDLFGFRGLRAG